MLTDRKVEIHARSEAALKLMEGKMEETEVGRGDLHTSVSRLLPVTPAGRTRSLGWLERDLCGKSTCENKWLE